MLLWICFLHKNGLSVVPTIINFSYKYFETSRVIFGARTHLQFFSFVATFFGLWIIIFRLFIYVAESVELWKFKPVNFNNQVVQTDSVFKFVLRRNCHFKVFYYTKDLGTQSWFGLNIVPEHLMMVLRIIKFFQQKDMEWKNTYSEPNNAHIGKKY